MVDELEQRERAFKKARVEKDREERSRWTENERIKDEGRRLREERARAMADASVENKRDSPAPAGEEDPPVLGAFMRTTMKPSGSHRNYRLIRYDSSPQVPPLSPSQPHHSRSPRCPTRPLRPRGRILRCTVDEGSKEGAHQGEPLSLPDAVYCSPTRFAAAEDCNCSRPVRPNRRRFCGGVCLRSCAAWSGRRRRCLG